MQCNQRVMHSFAHSQKPLASADDRGISALGEIDLIFDHLHHGLAGREKVYCAEPVFGENGRYHVRLTENGVIIGVYRVPKVYPRSVVSRKQRLIALVCGISRRDVGEKRQPVRQEIAAQSHVLLSVAGNLSISALKRNLRIGKARLHKGRLRAHHRRGRHRRTESPAPRGQMRPERCARIS